MKIVKLIGTLFGWLLVIALLVLVAAFICMLIGRRCRKNDDARRKQDSKSKVQPKLRKDAPQPTEEQRLQREKKEILRAKRTAYAGKITVQDALNTFSAEEQQRFENQLYQYSQDTGRAGLSPEIAAANRGMVFVDGRPVAKEVATRLDEMRNAVSLKEAERTKVQQALDDAVKILRDQIITEITERSDVKYQLTDLLYGYCHL
ncbi:MAG: hypothetical protein MR308_07370 [Lachnospiraceae bacterium]|nr:hypothetical protein [Lachnospiraceae bacterium]